MGTEEDLGQQLSAPTVNSRFTSKPPTLGLRPSHVFELASFLRRQSADVLI
jgi:hypothetical protein